jgi:hypothetical protein
MPAPVHVPQRLETRLGAPHTLRIRSDVVYRLDVPFRENRYNEIASALGPSRHSRTSQNTQTHCVSKGQCAAVPCRCLPIRHAVFRV